MERHHEAVGAHPRDFLHHDRIVDEIDAAAAVFSRRVGAEKTLRAHLAPARAIAHPVAIPLRHLRLDFGFDEASHLVAEHFVFFGEDISSHQSGSSIPRSFSNSLRLYRGRLSRISNHGALTSTKICLSAFS